MVKLEEDEVYKALNSEWKSGEEIYQYIRRERGLDNLSFLDKIKYILNFQYPDLNRMKFHIHIANLRAEESIELRREKEDADIMSSQIRKTKYGRKTQEPIFYLAINPFLFLD